MSDFNFSSMMDTLGKEFLALSVTLAEQIDCSELKDKAYLQMSALRMKESHPVVEESVKRHIGGIGNIYFTPLEETEYLHLYCFRNAFWLTSLDSIGERLEIYIYEAHFDYQWAIRMRPMDDKLAMKILLKGINKLHECLGIMLINGMIESEKRRGKVKKKVAKSGGTARADRNKPVKFEVIRLLKEKKIIGGWKKKKDAINDIEEDLWGFITRLSNEIEAENRKLPTYEQKRHIPGLLKESLPRLLMDWSRNDATVKAAFQKAIQPKNKHHKGAL